MNSGRSCKGQRFVACFDKLEQDETRWSQNVTEEVKWVRECWNGLGGIGTVKGESKLVRASQNRLG